MSENSRSEEKCSQIPELLSKNLLFSDQEPAEADKDHIFAVAKLAESRDPDANAHLQRIQGYCCLLAQRLAERSGYADIITSEFIDTIHMVAPLHDIGKASIPDEILMKKGKLTTDEFHIIKTHTHMGNEILDKALSFSDKKVLRIASNLILYHHENFDGQGYPEGLYGEQIPLEARIMAVADVYDALVSRRAYKPPYGRDETYFAIQRLSGTKFDPIIAEIALANMTTFESIYLQTT